MRMAGEGEEEATCGDLFDNINDLFDFPVEHLHIAGDADLLPGESAGTSWAAAGDKFPGFSFSDDDPFAARVLPEEGSELDSCLSKFVEDSFSAGGGMGMKAKSEFQTASHVSELEGVSVTGAGNGESTPFAAVATPSRDPGKRRGRPPSTFLSSHDLLPGAKKKKKKPKTTAKLVPTGLSSAAPAGTKCMHCKATKTPQWRAGPLGPKTLCNACGVRFVSGRLFPEYRPSASPTFVAALHSNFHSKVVEMRVKSGQPAPAPVPFFGSKPNTDSVNHLPVDVTINTGTNSFLVIE